MEMATWPKCKQSGYITPAVLGVPNARRGGKKQKWLPAPHVGKVATSPLLSWGSPTLSAGRKNGNGYLAHMWAKWLHHPYRLGGPQRSPQGEKMEMATWPTCGQSGYITPVLLGAPNAQRGDNKQKWLPGPNVGKVTTSPLTFWLPGPHVGKMTISPLPCWGSPMLSTGRKNSNGYLAQMWAK